MAGKKKGPEKGVPFTTPVLKDMRYVYRNPEQPNETEAQQLWRKVMRETPRQFAVMMRGEEKEYQRIKEEARARRDAPNEDDSPSMPVDEAEEMEEDEMLSVMEKLYAEWEEEEKGARS